MKMKEELISPDDIVFLDIEDKITHEEDNNLPPGVILHTYEKWGNMVSTCICKFYFFYETFLWKFRKICTVCMYVCIHIIIHGHGGVWGVYPPRGQNGQTAIWGGLLSPLWRFPRPHIGDFSEFFGQKSTIFS